MLLNMNMLNMLFAKKQSKKQTNLIEAYFILEQNDF